MSVTTLYQSGKVRLSIGKSKNLNVCELVVFHYRFLWYNVLLRKDHYFYIVSF